MKSPILACVAWFSLLSPALLPRPCNAESVWPPEAAVAAVLAHSPALASATLEMTVRAAQADAADAARRPDLRLEARAVHYDGLEDATLGPGVTLPAIQDRYHAAFMLTQTLYAGGRIQAGREAAREQKAVADARMRATRSDLALQVLVTYWGWSRNWHAIRAREDSVRRLEAQARDTRNRFTAGLTPEYECLATDTRLASARLDAEDARRAEALARNALRALTGDAVPADAIPAAPETPDADAVPDAQADADFALALQQRPEYAAARAAVRAAEAAERASRAGNRPQVQLVGRAGEASPNLNQFPPDDRWREDVYGGVQAAWSLYDGGANRAQRTEARARADQARTVLVQVEDALREECRAARIRQAAAVNRLQVTETACTSARRTLEATLDHWRNGLARHSEVLEAEAEVSRAEYEHLSAQAGRRLADVQVAHALGRLLPEPSAAQAAP